MSIAIYHCFPRPRYDENGLPSETKTLGLDTLSLILEHGLLLTPEEQFIGKAEFAQSRMCFTALRVQELWAHSHLFGQFAIEYSVEDFVSLGGLPAVYLPIRATGANSLAGAGVSLIEALEYLRQILDDLKNSKDPSVTESVSRITANKTNLAVLAWVPVIVQNLFYPVDSASHAGVGELGYYTQREWKLINNFARSDINGKGEWDFKFLSDEQKAIFIKKNAWFAREFAGARRIDRSQLLHSIGEVSVVGKIKRIIVPAEHLGEAAAVVKERRPLVALEDVVGISNADGGGI